MKELKPCPFCGGSNIVVTHETADASVYCADCYGEIKIYRKGVIASDLNARWNTRPLEDALRTENARLTAEIEMLSKRHDEATRPTISNIVGIISSVVCDETCPVETGGPACLKERDRCMAAYQREAEKIYARAVAPLKEEIEALNALVEALEWCLHGVESIAFTRSYFDRKEYSKRVKKVASARARLEEVRNA
ncbi:Lar family restriction alleviation protein [Desulfovibrio sp. OttesenSCG-928-A18]|nr:Lar family restriction alleviation protein [Desulfovibrio sp. OttesenSCG-928-A18]